MRAVRSARRHIVMVKIRLLDLKKVLSPKAPAHILWLKCAAYLSLINPLEAAQLWGKVRPQACSDYCRNHPDCNSRQQTSGRVGWLRSIQLWLF